MDSQPRKSSRLLDPAARAEELQLMLSTIELGTLTIVDAPKHTMQIDGRRRWCVTASCSACDRQRVINVESILRGQSKNCKCQTRRKHGGTKGALSGDIRAQRLGERYDAIIQRCYNPSNRSWANYGGRGIRNEFQSREAFIAYGLEHLAHANYRGVDIDRIDNNGNYAPGNLRLVSRRANLSNRRNTHRVEYKGIDVVAHHLWHILKLDYPAFALGLDTTGKLARSGITWQEILAIKPRRSRSPCRREFDPDVLAMYGIVPALPQHP